MVFLNYIHKFGFISSPDNFSTGGIVSADTTKTVTIKLSLTYNADIDNSGRVDGRDLALLAFFFGKEEREYASNLFKVNPDINGDMRIDGDDLVIMASHFGLPR